MKLGEWLQIAANLGIMIGLVMVALQMRQTDAINESQLIAQYRTYVTNQQIALGDDFAKVFAKVIDDPDELTDEDLIRYHFFVNSYVVDLVQIKILADLGYMSPSMYRGLAASEITCGLYGGHKVGKAYLETMHYGVEADDEIGQLIVKRIESCGSWQGWLDTMREKIASQTPAV
jgi:hypothetical protein